MAGLSLQKLKQLFDEADVDKDGRLKQEEFINFVKTAYNKDCPPQMYTSLCTQLKTDKSVGLEWVHAKAVFLQSNSKKPQKQQKRAPQRIPPAKSEAGGNIRAPNTMERSKSTQNKRPGNDQRMMRATTPQPHSSHKHRMVAPDHTPGPQRSPVSDRAKFMKRAATAKQIGQSPSTSQRSHIKNNQSLSLSTEQNFLTENALRNHEYQQSMSAVSASPDIPDDQLSEYSDGEEQPRQLRHMRSRSRMDELARRVSIASDQSSSEVQILSMMESKLNQAKKDLAKEKQKRKQTEELTQQLLVQNDQYKNQLKDFQNQLKRSQGERGRERSMMEQQAKELEQRIAKMRTQNEDYKTTITHLEAKSNTMKSERDEAFKLLRKIEKEHDNRIKKLKNKQKEQIEKISNGFLQFLGVEPGQDVREVVKELKDNNVMLQKQVDVLAEQLSRKEQSLLEALNAIDSVSVMNDDTLLAEMAPVEEMEAPRQRSRLSIFRRKGSTQNREKVTEGSESKTQGKDLESTESISRTASARRASFYKNAATTDPRLLVQAGKTNVNTYLANTKQGQDKQLQFVTQSLAADVANKQDTIDNIQAANEALGNQVAQLQQQLQAMKKKTKVGGGNSDTATAGDTSELPAKSRSSKGNLARNDDLP